MVESVLDRGSKRDRGKPPVASTKFDFALDLRNFGDEWESAVQRARDLAARPAAVDGVTLRSLHVTKTEITFAAKDTSRAFDHDSTVYFTGSLAEAFPPPFLPGCVSPPRPGDIEFFDALEAATLEAGPIHVDELEELEGYWVFPAHSVDNTGALVDRRTGRAIEMGSSPQSMVIWGYERGLLEKIAGDLVIEEVKDRSRAHGALMRLAGVRWSDLDQLPLVLEGCASWRAVWQLYEAGDALTWRVRRQGA